MNPYLSATVKQVSVGAAGLVDAVYRQTSPPDIAKTFFLQTGRTLRVQFLPALGSVPPSVWVVDKPWFSACAFQGTTRTTTPVYYSALGPQQFIDASSGVHPVTISSLRTSLFTGVLADMFNCELQLLAGHSLGGAAVLTLASQCPPLRPGQQRGVVTFGSPRPFSGIGPAVKDCINVIRWMRKFDAITRFPPRQLESPATSLVLAALGGAWPAEWYQPLGGRLFEPNGRWTDAPSTGSLPGLTEIELLQWADSRTSSLSVAHEFVGYAASVANLIEDLEGFWTRQLSKPNMESPSFSNPPIELMQLRMEAGFPLPSQMRCDSGPSASKARHARPVT
jgi:hypothetical protein